MCKLFLIKLGFPGLFPEVLLLWGFLGAQEHGSSAKVALVLGVSTLRISGLVLKLFVERRGPLVPQLLSPKTIIQKLY